MIRFEYHLPATVNTVYVHLRHTAHHCNLQLSYASCSEPFLLILSNVTAIMKAMTGFSQFGPIPIHAILF